MEKLEDLKISDKDKDSTKKAEAPAVEGIAVDTIKSEEHRKIEEKLIFAPKDDQYTIGTLERKDLDENPFTQFHEWFLHAHTHKCHQPEATTLSTAHLPSGRVSARVVYLKELDHRGFVIYTNLLTSNKSKDLTTNPHASLTFWFREVERQVRVEGIVERLSPEESQVYFDTRIRGSRIGAWASKQSEALPNGEREVLEERVKEIEKRFEGVEKIPVPPFWGGLRIVPLAVEFWQGRQSRLHDRFRYERDSTDEKTWRIERLNP
ncbi:hypothetical protein DFH27DRAFT_592546 [Peziza echinospora]|nr:hypothetical protein DFH27DRAFT_592546 [Peziza echinospora]